MVEHEGAFGPQMTDEEAAEAAEAVKRWYEDLPAGATEALAPWYAQLCPRCGADQPVPHGSQDHCGNCGAVRQIESRERPGGTSLFLAGEYRAPEPRDADDLSAQALPPSALNRFGWLR